MPFKIVPVSSNAELAQFIRFPWLLYRDDPNWIAPLLGETYRLHNREKHPFWQHAEAQYFIAIDKAKAIGRIAAIDDSHFRDFQGVNCGYFGFFECIENVDVARALFEAAAQWLRARGRDFAIGPMNPSTNYECGTLVAGFSTPPFVMMTHNLPYYDDLIKSCGLTKEKDLYAWLVESEKVPERIVNLASYSQKKTHFNIRRIDLTKLDEEVTKVIEIYNSAWSKNWGFVPMTEAEFRHVVRDLKKAADPDILFIAETEDGSPAGFSVSLPDINQVFAHNRSGKLLPFGVLKFLYYSKRINRIRVVIFGIIEKYRNHGLDSAFLLRTFENGLKKGYRSAEGSWILEDNDSMNRILEDVGGKVHKLYRIYKMEL